MGGANAPSVSQELGVARTPDGTLHVAWREAFSDIRARPISRDGTLGATTTIVSGWDLGADPTLLADGGRLRAFFAAVTPIEGLLSATAPAAGSPWTEPTGVVDAEVVYGRTVGATSAADGTSIQTWYSGSDIVVHRGLSGNDVSTFGAAGSNSRPDIVTEARTGNVLVAWCSFGASSAGVFVRRIDPMTGDPVAAAIPLPGSTTDFQGQSYPTCVLESEVSRREPLAARAGGGVFVAGAAGYPTLTRVVVWRLDESGAVVSTLTAASAENVAHAEPAIAAAPDGRIWVAWLEPAASGGKIIVARRSNRAVTAFGARVTATPPGGISTGTVNLAAQALRVDVLAIVAAAGTGAKSVQHTQLLPGLTLVRRKVVRRRHRTAAVTFAVLDAGDPVPNARVRAGGKSAVTGERGTATLVLRKGGVASATKPGYVGATTRFRCC